MISGRLWEAEWSDCSGARDRYFPSAFKTRRRRRRRRRRRVSRKQLSGFIAPSRNDIKYDYDRRLRAVRSRRSLSAHQWWGGTWMTVFPSETAAACEREISRRASIAREIRFRATFPIPIRALPRKFREIIAPRKVGAILFFVTRRPIKRIGKITPDRYFSFRQAFTLYVRRAMSTNIRELTLLTHSSGEPCITLHAR